MPNKTSSALISTIKVSLLQMKFQSVNTMLNIIRLKKVATINGFCFSAGPHTKQQTLRYLGFVLSSKFSLFF